MRNNEHFTETLNNPVKTYNDRIQGYEKAADKNVASDTDVRTVFLQMADIGRGYSKMFNKKIYNLDSFRLTTSL
ncbi:MAG: hypothetical protein ABIU11_06005 [Chitinophagaceae bacterium]